MLTIFLLAASACKTVDEDISQKDHLNALMNNRQYDQVINTIDSLSEEQRNQPDFILLRAEALSGKAGFDIITFTKLIKLTLKFDDLQRSFNKLNKSNDSDTSKGISSLGRQQMTLARAFIGLNGYLKVVELTPELNDSKRPILMESLVYLNKITPAQEAHYRRARTQSMMIHLIMFLTSFRKCFKNSDDMESNEDAFCRIDAQAFSGDLPWMTEQLVRAIEDAETVKKLIEGSDYKPNNIEAMKKTLDDLKKINPQGVEPGSGALTFKTLQSQFCGS